MSSEEEFLDIVYLGIFVILSPAFDIRFYNLLKPPPCLTKEMLHAVAHFKSILRIFSLRFIVVLDGEPVAHSYLVDRLLAEFAAASVVFAKAVEEADVDAGTAIEGKDGIKSRNLETQVEGVLSSYPHVLPYYSRCVNNRHKHFVWTGAKIQILPRSDSFLSTIALTAGGEMPDSTVQSIYTIDLSAEPLIRPTHTEQVPAADVQGDEMNAADEKPRKRKRQS